MPDALCVLERDVDRHFWETSRLMDGTNAFSASRSARKQRPTGDVAALAILSKCRDRSVMLMPAMPCRRRMTGIACTGRRDPES
jgi:hypothetical protein